MGALGHKSYEVNVDSPTRDNLEELRQQLLKPLYHLGPSYAIEYSPKSKARLLRGTWRKKDNGDYMMWKLTPSTEWMTQRRLIEHMQNMLIHRANTEEADRLNALTLHQIKLHNLRIMLHFDYATLEAEIKDRITGQPILKKVTARDAYFYVMGKVS